MGLLPISAMRVSFYSAGNTTPNVTPGNATQNIKFSATKDYLAGLVEQQFRVHRPETLDQVKANVIGGLPFDYNIGVRFGANAAHFVFFTPEHDPLWEANAWGTT